MFMADIYITNEHRFQV